MTIHVCHFDSERIENPNLCRETSFVEFTAVRNAILELGSRFDISNDGGNCYDAEELQYSDERFVYVNAIGRDGIILQWIEAAADILRGYSGWGIVVGSPFGWLYLFEDRLMAPAPAFARCRDLESIVKKINACGPFPGCISTWVTELPNAFFWEESIRKQLAALGISDVTYHHRHEKSLVVTCQNVLVTVVERPLGIAVERTDRGNFLSQNSLNYSEYCEIAATAEEVPAIVGRYLLEYLSF